MKLICASPQSHLCSIKVVVLDILLKNVNVKVYQRSTDKCF